MSKSPDAPKSPPLVPFAGVLDTIRSAQDVAGGPAFILFSSVGVATPDAEAFATQDRVRKHAEALIDRGTSDISAVVAADPDATAARAVVTQHAAALAAARKNLTQAEADLRAADLQLGKSAAAGMIAPDLEAARGRLVTDTIPQLRTRVATLEAAAPEVDRRRSEAEEAARRRARAAVVVKLSADADALAQKIVLLVWFDILALAELRTALDALRGDGVPLPAPGRSPFHPGHRDASYIATAGAVRESHGEHR